LGAARSRWWGGQHSMATNAPTAALLWSRRWTENREAAAGRARKRGMDPARESRQNETTAVVYAGAKARQKVSMAVSPELRPGQRNFKRAKTGGREAALGPTLSTVNAVAPPLPPPHKRHTRTDAIPTHHDTSSASESGDRLQRRPTSVKAARDASPSQPGEHHRVPVPSSTDTRTPSKRCASQHGPQVSSKTCPSLGLHLSLDRELRLWHGSNGNEGVRAAFTGPLTTTPVTLHNGVRCPRANTTTAASMGPGVVSGARGRSRWQRVVVTERVWSSVPVTGGRHSSQRVTYPRAKTTTTGASMSPSVASGGGGLVQNSARAGAGEGAESAPGTQRTSASCTSARTHRCGAGSACVVDLRSNDVDQSYLTCIALFEVQT